MLEIETEFMLEIVVRWALPTFQRSVAGYIETAVIVLRLILVDFSQNFSERALEVHCLLWSAHYMNQ